MMFQRPIPHPASRDAASDDAARFILVGEVALPRSGAGFWSARRKVALVGGASAFLWAGILSLIAVALR